MSLFQVQGFAANPLKQIITGTGATIITIGTLKTAAIPFFRVSEYAGGTANLTVEIYNSNTSVSYYLGSGGFTWNTKALTAKQSILFDDGYDLDLGDQLRITCSVGSNVMVTGLYFGKQNAPAWTPIGQRGQ